MSKKSADNPHDGRGPVVAADKPHDGRGPVVAADRARAVSLLDVSRETWQAFDHFVDRLSRWQGAQNLVSGKSLDAVWTRHIVDCAQLFELPDSAGNWLDFGAGAGLPGLIGAILAKYQSRAGADKFVLVESNQRKCAFLRTISRELGLNTQIMAKRVDAIRRDEVSEIDHISGRAVADLAQLLAWGQPWWAAGADGFFQKGRDYCAEIEKASDKFHFDLVCSASRVDAESVILQVKNIRARKGK